MIFIFKRVLQLHFITCMLLCLFLFGCSSGFQYVQKKYENGEYQVVIDILKEYLKTESDAKRIAKYSYFIAESYRLSNRIEESVFYYKEAMDKRYEDIDMNYHYATSLKANGRYDDAKKQFQYYLRQGQDKRLLALARNEVKQIDAVKKISIPNEDIEIYNCASINTESAEFSPVFYRDMLVFASDRRKEAVYTATGGGYLDFYYFDFEDYKQCNGELYPFDEILNVGEIHEASPAFSRDNRTMIFARNVLPDKSNPYEVNLFISQFEDDAWQEAEKLPISLDNYWDGCPALSRNNNVLYFASNRPGGYGGLDLYLSRRNKKGEFGRVVNMGGKINSKGNDMFPFVSSQGKLYYSSEGHTGLGRLDIFVATRANKKITVKNMGTPFNSSADDFGIIFIDNNRGFFSSNRKINNPQGDDDIYYFEDVSADRKIVNYFLAGTVTQQGSDAYISGAKVILQNIKNETVEEVFSDERGRFRFKDAIEIGPHYTLLISKSGYANHKEIYTTIDKAVPEESLVKKVTNITLEAEVGLYKDILDKIPVGEEVNLYILYDLNSSDIREDAAKILDGLVEILLSRPEIRIELGAHTDTRASHSYNARLSRRRAKSAVQYIIKKGVGKSRIVAKGYGEDRPLIPKARTEEEHQRNRRTTIKVID